MDRLAAHVIATAALTVTLATVPVLFADASHAASSAAPASPTAAASPAPTAAAGGGAAVALPALPPLAAAPQTTTPATARTPSGSYSFVWREFRRLQVRPAIAAGGFEEVGALSPEARA